MSVSLIDGRIDDDVQMTEEQIVAALESCTDDSKGITQCSVCPYHKVGYEDYCVQDLLSKSLELINRKNAELDKLEKELKESIAFYKTAAIEEYAERLKTEKFTERFCGQKYSLIHSWIDTIAKEMVSKEKNEKKLPMEIYFKLGVNNGFNLLCTCKFNSFEEMIQEAKKIDERYKGDMKNCNFVFQAFIDDSYDFKKACFSQIQIPVNGICNNVEYITDRILKDFETNKGVM